MNRYIVKTACAKMPSSCRGQYRKVALIKLAPGFSDCAKIDIRDKAIETIVDIWPRLHAEGVNTAYAKTLAHAQELAAKYNQEDAEQS